MDGAAFTRVTFADGGYGIIRRGRLVDGRRWPGGEIERCIRTLVDLAGLDDDDGQPA